ncbi:hypothetical protein [Haematobacter genomosp. 1]|uniref:Uncharacterized protein n=1 Tax=Haematobacter genomosp. 1 TaxID=366618 RepID=A0A212ABT1_9RHOB|nr:hypothetical protein [Haematobacter genomosp. 1]OWJ78156.1 hypothetical protein CDV49_09350 [Haematobacter genomosp. 1]
MPDTPQDDQTSPRPAGLPPEGSAFRQLPLIDIAAAALTLLWLVIAAVFFFTGDGSEGGRPLSALVAALAVLMPVALIWLIATSLRTVRRLREEAASLQQEIDALRRGATAQPLRQPPVAQPPVSQPSAAQVLPPLTAGTAARAAQPARRQPAPPRAVPQQAAPEAAEQEPLPPADFIGALNFPDSPDDAEGIRTLRRALEDPTAAKLIRSAQDVLNLLGADGIYMDDLVPEELPPGALWRQFSEGARGQSVAGLGAIEEPNVLAATATRMRSDPVFRDAAQHFLRQFDRSLSDFAPTVPDEMLAMVGMTRTARAFMLLGRVAGTFD